MVFSRERPKGLEISSGVETEVSDAGSTRIHERGGV